MAFFGRSVVGCAPPAHPPDIIDSPENRLPRAAGPGYDPGAGWGSLVCGVVARSEVDAVPDGAGQGGGPVMGHDGGHGGVDPPGGVFAFLGQPGAAGVLAEYGVADVAG